MFKCLALLVLLTMKSNAAWIAQAAPAPGWENRLQQRLGEFLACKDKIDDASPCNRFVGKALADVYRVDDFKDPSKAGEYLSANLIETYVTVSKNWVLLGTADDQKVLDEAAMAANQGRAVIAVKMGEKHGHVAIVLPGTQSDSPTWKLRVPNSAAFFLDFKSEAYVGGKLSRAFRSPSGVKLFARVS